MERLNRDVILHICSYLDLGEQSSLAAVFPQLAPDIFRTLKNTAYAFKMRILPQYTSIGVFHERRSKQISLDDSGIQVSLQDSLRMDMVLGAWKELRRTMRKHVPYDLLYIACLDITQFGSSTVSQDLQEYLGHMRTDQLSLKFEDRREAKKILKQVLFNPGATLYIHELSLNVAGEPLVIAEQLENVGDVWFCGDIMAADFITLLSSKIPTLCLTCDHLRQDCIVIVREYLKNFLDGKTNQISCRISASGGLLRHVFEYIAGIGEDCMSNGARRIHLISALEETPIHCFVDAVYDDNK